MRGAHGSRQGPSHEEMGPYSRGFWGSEQVNDVGGIHGNGHFGCIVEGSSGQAGRVHCSGREMVRSQ